MTNAYTNLTLLGPNQQLLIETLKKMGRSAFVSPTIGGQTVVYDEECEEQWRSVRRNLASTLSKDLSCPVIAVSNKENQVLEYHLYHNDQVVDEYHSTPGYFRNRKDIPPVGGNAEALCTTFRKRKNKAIEHALRAPSEDQDFAFATDRHRVLFSLLNLPNFSVGYGYKYLSQGDFPEEIDFRQLEHVA